MKKRSVSLRIRRRTAVSVAVLAVLSLAIGGSRLQGGDATAQSSPGVPATRADLTVTVRGVGQIAEAGAAGQLSAAPGGTASGADTVGLAVFPRTSGQIVAIRVAPGRSVSAGEPLVVLDDGGIAAAAIAQARLDVTSAELELRQRQSQDPSKGSPPTAAELAAGKAALTSARARLERVLAPPSATDVSAARLDVKRAEAELETALGGTREARADALLFARQNVGLAQDGLDRVLAPANPADVAAARAELSKAEADLEALVRSDRTQPVTKKEIDAAKSAIEAARLKLAQVLAPPDPADVAAAQVELERARAELRHLEAGPSRAALGAAQQAVTAARTKLKLLLASPRASDVTPAQLDISRARAELAVLRARRGPATAAVISLSRLTLESARARLRAAISAAGLLTVRAPRAGTVTALLTTLGAHVDPPTPTIALADLGHLQARVELSEFDIARVRRGQRATVSVDALGGKTFPGNVSFAALTGTNASGVVTFPVEVSIAHGAGLKPGMNVSVRIVVARRRNVLTLPLDAVTQEGGEASVLTLDSSGKSVTRIVELGLSNNKSVEIVKGLRAGERVLLEEPGGGGEG